MIVNINDSNFQDYYDIFAEAFQVLKDNGFDVGTNANPDKTNFSSLAEYYSHMADLFNLRQYRYVMLPLDEEPFTINLNDRSISIPAGFSKCASVQTDQLAETIIFIADRYFDYMDLNNTEIYVQWITPDGTHGATHVEMRDLASEPNKIRFAWPLNEAITKTPGNVRFSVRFLRVDSNEKVVYSLNTLDKDIIIKPVLKASEPSVIEKPVGHDEFKKAVINSNFSAEGIPDPMTPSFSDPGADITINPQKLDDEALVAADSNILANGAKVVGLNADNTITLYAQAVTPDSGTIRYEWFYKPEGETKSYPVTAYPVEGQSIGTVAEESVLANAEFEDGIIPERNFPERYYDVDGTVYTSPFPTVEGTNLYTKFSTYTVAPGDTDITGTYYVKAYNDIKVGDKTITSVNYAQSRDCLIPGPKEIVITEDLEDGIIIADDDTLEIALQIDDYNPTIKYEWRKSVASAEDVLNKDVSATVTTDIPELEITAADAPAWYSVRAVSSLNRKSKDKFSTACKVTLAPLPPVVTSMKNDDTEHQLVDGPAILTVAATPAGLVEGKAASLFSETLHYVWQMRPIDKVGNNDWSTIPSDSTAFVGQGTNVLTVNDIAPYGGITCRCLVINELNGEKAIFDHSGDYVPNADEYLGEFKNEIPYIYDSEDNLNYTYYVLA